MSMSIELCMLCELHSSSLNMSMNSRCYVAFQSSNEMKIVTNPRHPELSSIAIKLKNKTDEIFECFCFETND